MNNQAVCPSLFPTLIVTLLSASVTASATDFEVAADRRAADILADDVREGPHHVVSDTVRNDGYLDYYTVESDYGEFEATGATMLATRVGEINALAELESLSKSEVFAKAAAEAGIKQLRTLQAFATRPVSTVKGIPTGVGRLLRGFKRDAEEAIDSTQELLSDDDEGNSESTGDRGSDSNKAVELTESYFGVSKAQRAWARKLGTDPYSTNEVLQAAIKEIAWAERLGKFGMSFVSVPKIPGADIVADVNELVWSKDPRELEDLNRQQLGATGADEALVDSYLDNRRLTPTQKALLTASIVTMADADGANGILEQSLVPETEAETGFFVQSVTMLAGYHNDREPLARIATDAAIPAGITADGKLVLLIAADHLYWNETIAAAASRFGAFADGERELWLPGTVSTRAASELQTRGWSIHANASNQ